MVAIEQSCFDTAEALLERSLTQHRALENGRFIGSTLLLWGQLMQRRGRPEEAVERYREACDLAAETGFDMLWARARAFGTVALAEAGRSEEAAGWLAEARSADPTLTGPLTEATVARHAGQLSAEALSEVIEAHRERARTDSALRWLLARARVALERT